jgi:hypothetical protein
VRAQLTEDDIKAVLARAEDIHLRAGPPSGDDIMVAAEEAGLPREAVEQALRERFELFGEPPKVGDLVFAKSSDDRHYVAEVVAESPNGFRIRFAKGSESTVPLASLRPCSFLPGEEIVVNWPWWGWWTVTVEQYDASAKSVLVTDGWTNEWFAMSDVRLDPPKKPRSVRHALAWTYVALTASGGAIGALVTWLLVR